jgi:hypothetical protein
MRTIMTPTMTAVALSLALVLNGMCWAGDWEPVPESYRPPHPSTYLPKDRLIFLKYRDVAGDPRPLVGTPIDPRVFVPKELMEKLTYDIEEMKRVWAEVVGFRAPDVVGKIAPHIKPGHYTYDDVMRDPGFKELMWPGLMDRIKPGGPPLAGNFPEFTIVPTRQLYWALPVGLATKKYAGQTQLDEQGYWKYETYTAGYPFPKPTGKFKAQQYLYNVRRNYQYWEQNVGLYVRAYGVDRRFTTDFDAIYDWSTLRLSGRVMMPPYGWFDKIAERDKSAFVTFRYFHAPRDTQGLGVMQHFYLPDERFDDQLLYAPTLRRVRKLSTTDTQDPIAGMDALYDDSDTYYQKMNPDRYPYEYSCEEMREYLVPVSIDGTGYYAGLDEGYALKNVTLERRPIAKLILKQLDRNYVYSKKEIFVDAEVFVAWCNQRYDWKDRIYRSNYSHLYFFPESGMFDYFAVGGYLWRDHIDLHSSVVSSALVAPCYWNREDVSLQQLMTKGK